MPPPTLAAPTPERTDLRGQLAVVAICAVASLCLYALFPHIAAGLAMAEPSYAGEVFPWVPIVTKQSLAASQEAGAFPSVRSQFLGLCATLFVLYLLVLSFVRDRESTALQSLVFIAGALFMLIHLLAPVMLSTDLYAYAIYGRVVSVYGGNPYSPSPPISPTDPFVPLFDQGYLPSWYGPLWTFISAGLVLIGGENVGWMVLLFRGLAILAALTTTGCIWSILRRISPQRATQGLVLFLWNPLLVIETGLCGHNDPVMLVMVLLGVCLHLRGWQVGAVVLLTLSALVKFLTGMLVPLYVWMVLRQMTSWRQRAGFLAGSALAAGLVSLGALWFAKADVDVPASHAATSPDFYANNFHELVFKSLRRCLGESEESVDMTIYFQSWWIAARHDTDLRVAASPNAEIQERLDGGARLLVIAPQVTDWALVYNPASRQKGFVDTSDFDDTDRPTIVDTDPELQRLQSTPMDWPTVRTANGWIRVATWILFAAFGLLAAWRTTTFEQFLVWSAAALIASYYLIITEIWPWYINWALAVGALAPARVPARFAVLLSASVLTLYVTIDFAGSDQPWIYTYRSVPAFVLPLFGLLLIYWRGIRERS